MVAQNGFPSALRQNSINACRCDEVDVRAAYAFEHHVPSMQFFAYYDGVDLLHMFVDFVFGISPSVLTGSTG